MVVGWDIYHFCFSSRVAQLLVLSSSSCSCSASSPSSLLVVNTHLSFPHNCCSAALQLFELKRILQQLDQTSHHLLSSSSSLTILFCGDFNASSRSPVYRLMEERGFLSSFQRAHGREALITHKDHRSRLVACDYIWFKQWFREEEEEEEGTQPKNGEEEEEEEETLLVHKQNKRMEERIRRVYVLKACLLPEGVPDEEWPEQQEGQFVSDHRPVLSSFRFG